MVSSRWVTHGRHGGAHSVADLVKGHREFVEGDRDRELDQLIKGELVVAPAEILDEPRSASPSSIRWRARTPARRRGVPPRRDDCADGTVMKPPLSTRPGSVGADIDCGAVGAPVR